VDVNLACESDAVVPLLLQSVKPRTASVAPAAPDKPPAPPKDAVTLQGVGAALRTALKGIDFCVARLPLGWNGAYLPFRHPLDYVGVEGGAGVGAGPGIIVGAALALKDSGRLPIGLLGDGDFLMANTVLWTAVHYKIPCLMIVCNNRSYFNDERHQEAIAVRRGRPAENRWIGLRIDDPDIDIAAIARGQGATGIGPVKEVAEVQPALEQGIATVRAGGVCVIDMRVQPGYDAE
jgi:thiamine pyrophosphate-dependent acetolactate synthase large subunit-like protein